MSKALKIVAEKKELRNTDQRKVDADLLTKAVMLNMTIHKWTNRCKTDADPVGRKKSEKAADRLRTTMKMIESDALDAIVNRLNETKVWALARCMPSFMVRGIFLVKLEAVADFERKFAETRDWLLNEGIPALCRDYDRAKDQAREDFRQIANELGIENPYNDLRYPDAREFYQRFGVDHNWISFGVPQSLPLEIRRQEQAKIQEKFERAAEEIEAALREGFAEVVAHATERLTVKPGEQKKIIRDSLIDNFKEFCQTFRLRNLTNDVELQDLVDKAEAIMSDVRPETLREKPSARRAVASQLNEIKAEIDKMIAEAPVRRFAFDDEEG